MESEYEKWLKDTNVTHVNPESELAIGQKVLWCFDDGRLVIAAPENKMMIFTHLEKVALRDYLNRQLEQN